ncbi:hypothetical protein C8034_v008283 [Colletotrichum sidae]|uniref:Uncharacterized protein n=1 Tax=Colletotrichum sidae TaxID=1347389 RepID=A0A4R8T2L0_9PEZI|nr:hypothetical protein C8034_v008283 [Colletotrichum sidae]
MGETSIDLQSVDQSTTSDSQRVILSLVKQPLVSTQDSANRSTAIADGLRRLGASQPSEGQVEGFLWDLWMVMVDVAYLVPPDHPWQDVLVEAVKNLQQTGGRVGTQDNDEPFLWSNLPKLNDYLLDKWFDPTELEEWSPEDVDAWKNLNSFASRLITPSFHPWLHFSQWQLKSALEDETPQGAVLDSRLWVATEWVLRCGELVFRLEGLNLGDSISGEGLRQLSAWKDRLAELEQQSEALELPPATAQRAKLTAEKMAEIEGNARRS